MRKQDFREKFKRIRNRIPENRRRLLSRAIARRFYCIPELAKVKVVAVYLSKGSEADTLLILDKILSMKKIVAVPRAAAKKRTMDFFRIRSLKKCHPGAFKILEPNEGCPLVPSDKIELILVPGIVFDVRGYRLGYGKGFYDRFLKKVPSVFSVGLTFEKNFVKKLPHTRKDFPVRCIVTEKRVCRVKERLGDLITRVR